MNNSLVKKISLQISLGCYNGSMGDILYLSQNLFSTDSKIDFMYVMVSDTTYYIYTGIYNEDGALLFSDT